MSTLHSIFNDEYAIKFEVRGDGAVSCEAFDAPTRTDVTTLSLSIRFSAICARLCPLSDAIASRLHNLTNPGGVVLELELIETDVHREQHL